MKIALVTTPASVRSGIGDATRHLLPDLRERCDVETFVEARHAGEDLAGQPTRSAAELDPRAFERIVYQLGNDPAHAFMLPMLAEIGGTVVLHEWILFDLARAAVPGLDRGGWRGLLSALRLGGLGQGIAYRNHRRGGHLAGARFRLALNRAVVRIGDAFLVHSEVMRKAVLEDRNAPTAVGLVRPGAERRWRDEERRVARERLGLPAEWRDGFLVVAVGRAARHKRIEPLLAALRAARRERADVYLALVGERDEEHPELDDLLAAPELRDAARLTGWVPEETLWDYLHAADVCVSLRGPSTGKVSSGLFQALSCGRGVIVTELKELRELPSSCALKVTPDEHEVATLARLLVDLRDHPARRDSLEAGARRFVDTECHWSRVADRYCELLEAFPAHHARRKSLIRTAIDASDQARGAADRQEDE